MSALSDWNSRQIRVLRRYCRRWRMPATPEVIAHVAARYAARHADERRLA